MNLGAVLLDDVSAFIRRFVALTPVQADLIALWVIHTYATAACDVTPYLAITSPEKQSGKTRLLEALEILVNKPWMTGRTSAAALVRKVETGVTLLLDETDAAFQGEKEYSEVLRGVLNSGHRRGGKASLCVGQGANIEVKDFHVFGPKALAGIGKLPDTVQDRSIPIRLKRKPPSERVERFRHRLIGSDAASLRERIAAWANASIDILKAARPELPDQLSDRQQDGIEPLLAIADLAGDRWPARARRAACDVFASNAAEDDSVCIQLLSDIRHIIHAAPGERMLSAELVQALCEIEGAPWAEWSHGKAITPNTLATLIKPFEVAPKTIRTATGRAKGYSLDMFSDAFTRYLRPLSRDIVTDSKNGGSEAILNRATEETVTYVKSTSYTHRQMLVTDVTARKPASAEPVTKDYLLQAAIAHGRTAGQVSVTGLMETLLVSRAAAIEYIDAMEEMGLLSPANGSGPRPFKEVVQ